MHNKGIAMKTLRMISAVLFVLFLSVEAYGATLLYSPDNSSVTVVAGSEREIPLTVTLEDAGYGTYYLWFIGSTDGDLPGEWISSAPSTSFISKWWSSASTTLTIKVPEDTPTGTYAGYLFSKAMRVHSYAGEGDGMYLEVHVPSSCSGKPSFNITSFGPEELWPPNGETENVTVAGMVEMPEGCTLFDAGYSIEDEYGIHTGVGEFSVDSAGSFSVVIPIEASRLGRDKDGRHYGITLYAEDEAGIGTSRTLEVLVPHDRRK
jgi:hypothetical protein